MAVPLAIPGGGAPGRRIRAPAFGRIDDTLSVVDKGTAMAVPLAIPGGGAPGRRIRAPAFGRIDDTLSVVDKGTALTRS